MCLATTKKCFKTTLLKSEASNDPTDIDQSHSPLHSTFTEYSLKIYNKWATATEQWQWAEQRLPLSVSEQGTPVFMLGQSRDKKSEDCLE